MNNIVYYEVETLTGIKEMVQIENTDGSFTSMLKSTYDEQQAEQSTPIV
jgi:hypothetical protein